MGRPAIRRRSRAFLQSAPARRSRRDAPGVGRARLQCESRGGGYVRRVRSLAVCTSSTPVCGPLTHRLLRLPLKMTAVAPNTATMTDDATLPGWRHARWGLGALGVLLAACALHSLAKFDAGPLSWLLEKWGYNVVLVGSGLACLLRGITIRAERAAWLTMGVGVVGWAVGNVWYTAVLWDMDPIPIPSLSDVLWLRYYPVVYVAVAMLLRARIARFHASLWVDGALAALSVAALSAAVVFQSVLGTTGGQPVEVATNLAYPLGDLILLGMVTGGVALTGWKPGRTWGALAGSFILFGVSDGIYLWGNATGTWVAGSVFEAGWPAATLLLARAAWMPPRHVRPRPLQGRRMLVVPTLFALLGLTRSLQPPEPARGRARLGLRAGRHRPLRDDVLREPDDARRHPRGVAHRRAHRPRQPPPADARPRGGPAPRRRPPVR